jgi:hypothetical protein
MTKLTDTVEYDVWLEENQNKLDIIASETCEDKKPWYDREEFQERFYQEREDIMHYDISGLKDDEVKEVYQIIDELKGEAFGCDYIVNRLYGYIFVNLFSKLEEQVNAKGITCKIRKEF